MDRTITYLKKFDWILFSSVLMLASFGLLVLYSTSLSGGTQGVTGDTGNFWKQLVFVGIGIGIVLIAPVFNYRLLFGLAKPLFILSVILLLGVLLFGETVRGTTGWFGVAGFGVQPVEIVKLFLLIYLARFFSEYARNYRKIKLIVGSGAAVSVLVLLVFLQPDFGSALLLLAVWGSLLLVSGIRRSHLAVISLVLISGMLLSWVFVLQPYQKERIAVFWDPERDPLGRGYNVTQSIIAIGSGGLMGKGLGFGSQSQLRFLPERQTDFIFAALAEELGFVGVTLITVLFTVFLFRIWRIASRSRDDFTLFLTLGIMLSIAIEIFVNIGGNLRIMPVTGVTLPFLSYGGSSILTKFLMVGILQSITVRQ